MAPERMDTRMAGKITRKNRRSGPAPSTEAHSSMDLKSLARSAPVTARNMRGKVKTMWPMRMSTPDRRRPE